MSISNAQYRAIMRTYEEKQVKNRHLLEERRAYVYGNVPGYRELEDRIASVSVAQGKKLLEGGQDALVELKALLHDLRAQKTALLLQAGLGTDYLEPLYDCPKCRDTGYLESGEKCSCFREQIISLLYDQSNLKEQLEKENFSSLSYAYYTGQDLERFRATVETCRSFAAEFDGSCRNLLLYGSVGTGKSFLSGCIAKELMDAGRSVIYFSAAALFRLLADLSFQHTEKEGQPGRYEDLYQCDLLIIDDLGTETASSFSASQFFSCLNGRALRHKSTLISTNLSLEQLRDRYSERVFSRITDSFTMCRITGPDIRIYKKLHANRK